jgi:dihydrofolate synthase/folylpolyglutamate synthase
LNHPEQAFPIIHVGGTSGKGSTATMIASILTAAGYKTGLHLSPHLQILNERHQINQQLVPSSHLAAIFSEMQPAIESVAEGNPFGKPSYFEAQVALSLCYFRQAQVDVAVIEVGLGGRLDATNVVPAKVAVLTSVGLDHTAVLGDTIEAITREKAGIIKPGQIVVSGFTPPTAQAIVSATCQKHQVPWWQLGTDFNYQVAPNGRSFTISTPIDRIERLQSGLAGDFQIANAACAVAAVHALPNFEISSAAVRTGLVNAVIPGRMEVIQQHPLVILDGAHNPDKIQGAVTALNKLAGARRRIVVFGLKSDKAATDILPAVLEKASLLIVTTFASKGLWEPMEPEKLAEYARHLAPELPIKIIPNPLEAIRSAMAQAQSDDCIWVTGSLYLIGEVREHWYPARILIEATETGLSSALKVAFDPN